MHVHLEKIIVKKPEKHEEEHIINEKIAQGTNPIINYFNPINARYFGSEF